MGANNVESEKGREEKKGKESTFITRVIGNVTKGRLGRCYRDVTKGKLYGGVTWRGNVCGDCYRQRRPTSNKQY